MTTERVDDVVEDSARSVAPGILTWSSMGEAPRVVCHRHHLLRTVSVAVVVGTLLFAINQLDVVLAGDATTTTWVKAAATYLVPFCVANYGVLTATHRRNDDRAGRQAP